MRLRLAAGLMALAAAACGAPVPVRDAAAEPPGAVLRVASDLDNRPFAWVDEQGAPAGRDVEMMAAIGRMLGAEIEWVRMPFDALLPAVEKGGVDAVCATLGITAERAERVRFSAPYFVTTIAAVVRDGPGEPQTVADLAGLRVSASRGTTSERAVRLHAPDALLVLDADKDVPAAERLRRGIVDAQVMDGPAAAALASGSGGTLVVLGEPLDVERYAIALPMARAELQARIDAALAALEADGTLARLDRAHGLESAAGR